MVRNTKQFLHCHAGSHSSQKTSAQSLFDACPWRSRAASRPLLHVGQGKSPVSVPYCLTNTMRMIVSLYNELGGLVRFFILVHSVRFVGSGFITQSTPSTKSGFSECSAFFKSCTRTHACTRAYVYIAIRVRTRMAVYACIRV